jgi:hypothetical protein
MSTIQDYKTTVSGDAEEKEELLAKFPDPRRNTKQATGDTRRHTDADSMRREFSIPRWDREAFDWPTVVPNLFEHTWHPPGDEDKGGTDALVRGKPGKGKSTLVRYLAVRMVDINDEIVVWRGSTSRSEWLALAPWATVCLPKGVDVDLRLEPQNPSDPTISLERDELTEIVRDVVEYENPVQLNHEILEPGQIHIVYPDPKMRGCQEVYEANEERTYDTPPKREALFAEGDPATHWWAAWILARVDHGPFTWTTWIGDEIGDIFPQSAQKDQYGSYQKVELVRDSWVDLRKYGLTALMCCHSEKDVHNMIREKLRWRIQMRGTANPTTASDVVGFESVEMNSDLTSDLPVGKSLAYTETNFERFAYGDVPEATDYKLSLKMRT